MAPVASKVAAAAKGAAVAVAKACSAFIKKIKLKLIYVKVGKNGGSSDTGSTASLPGSSVGQTAPTTQGLAVPANIPDKFLHWGFGAVVGAVSTAAIYLLVRWFRSPPTPAPAPAPAPTEDRQPPADGPPPPPGSFVVNVIATDCNIGVFNVEKDH